MCSCDNNGIRESANHAKRLAALTFYIPFLSLRILWRKKDFHYNVKMIEDTVAKFGISHLMNLEHHAKSKCYKFIKFRVLCTKVPNSFLQTFEKMKLKIFNVKSIILCAR